jgi:hypothetical protein
VGLRPQLLHGTIWDPANCSSHSTEALALPDTVPTDHAARPAEAHTAPMARTERCNRFQLRFLKNPEKSPKCLLVSISHKRTPSVQPPTSRRYRHFWATISTVGRALEMRQFRCAIHIPLEGGTKPPEVVFLVRNDNDGQLEEIENETLFRNQPAFYS